MKSTDENLFPCERFNAERASAQIEHEIRYTQQVADAEKVIEDKKQDKDKDAAFWKAVYILIHVAAVLLVLTTLYRMWGQ